MLRLKTVTLGCKVNQYETEYVRQGLLRAGYIDATTDERADLCVVNTCTVTHEGDAKSRQAIRRLARDNPDARVVVMGCYATRAPEEVAALPGVAEVVTDKRELPDLLGRFGVVEIPTGLSDFSGRHRAFVKVQDGCLLRCSFCIIPSVRPHVSSRPIDDITAEVRRLIAAGFREIVLTGIHLGHYGVEPPSVEPPIVGTRGRMRLPQLLSRLMDIDAEFRVRLSSIEATEVTRELIDVMAAHPRRICPHLHICLQSGSDRVLARMKRRGGVQRFVDRCGLVQRSLNRPAITTDIIVGFPGETEADFQATCDVARQVGFSKMHIFPYSARRGTPAAEFADQVPADVKNDRVTRLEALEVDLRRQSLARSIGNRVQVLVQARFPNRPGIMSGTTCRYAPVEIAIDARFESQLVDGQVFAVHADRQVVEKA